MIGSKKLASIRRELQHASATAGGDPIEWLESVTASGNERGNEVLQSLRRIVKAKPKARKAGARSYSRK
jgi:hypothetical protein